MRAAFALAVVLLGFALLGVVVHHNTEVSDRWKDDCHQHGGIYFEQYRTDPVCLINGKIFKVYQ
jgi:hypothetical protein